MTRYQYKAERDGLLAGKIPIPSYEFCKEFVRRLDKGWELANKEDYTGDREDYHAWGYALFNDIHTNAEQETEKIGVWYWYQIYTTFMERQPHEFADAVTELWQDDTPDIKFIAEEL